MTGSTGGYAAPLRGTHTALLALQLTGEAEFADKLLSAMRFEFGGHNEKSTSK